MFLYSLQYILMRRNQTTESTEDQPSGLLERKGTTGEEDTEDESESWFGRARAKYGLGTLLAAAGVALFLFPEPATSAVGLLLIGAGVLLWIVGWLR